MSIPRPAMMLLTNPKYIETKTVKFRTESRDATGAGVDVYTPRQVSMSWQPVKENIDSSYGDASGERRRERFKFYSLENIDSGDLILHNGIWYRVSRPNDYRQHGYSAGEATSQVGASTVNDPAGFVVT